MTEEVRPWQERAESYPERLERKKRYWAEIAPRAIEPPAPPKRGFLNRLFNGAN